MADFYVITFSLLLFSGLSAGFCPEDKECSDMNRQPCDFSTSGKCGDCIDGLYEFEGSCVSEEEVKELVRIIEEVIAADDADDGTSKSDVKADDTKATDTKADDTKAEKLEVKSLPSSGIYVDKNADSTVSQGDSEAFASNAKLLSQENENDRIGAETAKPVSIGENPPNKNSLDKNDDKISKGQNEKRPSIPLAQRADTGASTKEDADAPLQAGTSGFSQLIFFIIVLSVSLVCVTSLIIAGVCWYRLYRQRKSAETSEYAGYGDDYAKKDSITRSESGDRKLAQSAQMYHYQHHKQQMIALEKSLSDKLDDSEQEDEADENEDGNYTVYMCPGLASTGEMEVQNPLFQAGNNNKQSVESQTSPQQSP